MTSVRTQSMTSENANIEQFFNLLFDGLEGYTPIVGYPGGKPGNGGLSAQTWFKLPEQMDDMVAHVAARSGDDLYATPFVFSEQRRKADFVTDCRVAYADADTCNPDLFKVKPTLTVESSPGRFQTYWLLPGVDPQQASRLSRRIAYAHADDGCDTSGWDIPQLLRVPGSTHNKYLIKPESYSQPYAVTLTDCTGEAHTVESIEANYPAVVAHEQPKAKRGTDATRKPLPGKVPTHIQERLDGVSDKEGSDDSKNRWQLILQAEQFGYTDGTILSLLDRHPATLRIRDRNPNRDWDALELAEIAKARLEHDHVGRDCSKAACPNKPVKWDDESGHDIDITFETQPIEEDPDNPRPVNSMGMPLIRPELTYEVSDALNHIRQAAYADVLCPDQVLHSTLDVLASYTSIKVAVDTGMRSPIQPNKATAIVGPPGTGKGGGRGAAKKILPLEAAADAVLEEMKDADITIKEYSHPTTEFPSTGEGMVEAYYEFVDEQVGTTNKTKKVKKQIAEGSRHFVAEEAQDFVIQGEKNGSITFPTFRSLAFDDSTGQSGATVETRRKLAKSTYRAVFTLGFQPDVFTRLLTEDHIGVGTPVRFDVCAASGVKLPRERTPHPGLWTEALLTLNMENPPEVTLAEELKDEIYDYERELQEGDRVEHPLAVHRTRRVVSRAILIALLEGQTHIDRRIWDISVELYEASTAAMSWLLERRRTSDRKRNDAKRDEKIRTVVAESNAVAEAQDERIARLLEESGRQIAGWMRDNDAASLPAGQAWKKITVKSRRDPLKAHFGTPAETQEAIWDVAESQGWLTFADGKVRLGETDPRA